MLKNAILEETRRRSLERLTMPVRAPGDEPPVARLAAVDAELRDHAAQRSALRRRAVPAPTGVTDDEHSRAFERIRAAVAEATAGAVRSVPDALLDTLPDLLAAGSPGAAAVREHWIEIGFLPAEVDAYLAEAAAAGPELAGFARSLRDVSDWDGALAHFGSGNPDRMHWGFGYAGAGTLHEDARAFATASRRAGITPSLYQLATITLLLEKAMAELGR